MNNISGIILTSNNARTIAECLKSIKDLVQEIIIIDDFSSDATLEIAKSIYPGVIIKQQKLKRFDEQRNFGIELASQLWILMIDSDEEILHELAATIKIETDTNNIDAYWTIRLNQFFDAQIAEEYINRPILFRNTLRFSYPVHEIILIDKIKTKKLTGPLIHHNWISIASNMEKMNKYSSLIAQKWLEQKRDYGNFKLFILALFLPIRYFFICFFYKKFYKAGLFRGVFYSLFESSWWLAVIFKYQELKTKK